MLCKRGDGVYVWLKLRRSQQGHHFFDTEQEGTVANLQETLAEMLELSPAAAAAQENC